MSDTRVSGINSREQRQAHIKALVDEIRDCKQSLGQARETLGRIPEEKLVRRARQQERINHLETRIADTQAQLSHFSGQSRTPREGAETRGGGQGGGTGGAAPAAEEETKLEDMSKADLEARVKERGLEDKVVGTGSNGFVKNEDLIKVLKA